MASLDEVLRLLGGSLFRVSLGRRPQDSFDSSLVYQGPGQVVLGPRELPLEPVEVPPRNKTVVLETPDDNSGRYPKVRSEGGDCPLGGTLVSAGEGPVLLRWD